MSKDFKQKQRIKFMHGLLSYKDVCIGLKKRWFKINFNWGRFKSKRNKDLEKEIDKQANLDLEEQSHT
jgi:hypothetical protein